MFTHAGLVEHLLYFHVLRVIQIHVVSQNPERQ